MQYIVYLISRTGVAPLTFQQWIEGVRSHCCCIHLCFSSQNKIEGVPPPHLTAPFPAVIFCRAPTAASWVWWRTLRAISDKYMRIAMALHSHSMPRGLAFSSSRGHVRSKCCRETVDELQVISHQQEAANMQRTANDLWWPAAVFTEYLRQI